MGSRDNVINGHKNNVPRKREKSDTNWWHCGKKEVQNELLENVEINIFFSLGQSSNLLLFWIFNNKMNANIFQSNVIHSIFCFFLNVHFLSIILSSAKWLSCSLIGFSFFVQKKLSATFCYLMCKFICLWDGLLMIISCMLDIKMKPLTKISK